MSETPKPTLRVVAYNALFKAPLHPEKIKGFGADVLMLMELAGLHNADSETIARDVAGDPDMDVFYVKHRLRGGGGTAILTRDSMQYKTEHTLLRSTLAPSLRRVLLQTAVKIPSERTTQAINTPADSLELGTAHLATILTSRNKRWEQTNALIERVQSKNRRFLLAGDFNDVPSSPFIREILDNTHLVNCGPDFDVPSWSYQTWTRTHGLGDHGKHVRKRLDYCFATPDVAAAVTGVGFGEAWPSDHCPLIVDIDTQLLLAA